VNFGDCSYSYHAGKGQAAWDWLSGALTELHADRFLVVSDRSLPRGVILEVTRHIARVAPAVALPFAGGETRKNLSTLQSLIASATDAGVSRRTCVVAVGGGVAGNVGGMLAALMFRGVRFVQIPTTLLAMSDSVLSLKQAVSSRLGKNDVGTFHAPEFVWANIDFLSSLPVKDRQAAMCELIKNVVAIHPEDHDEVAGLLDSAGEYSAQQYVHSIRLAIEHKSSVMANDQYEKGVAMVLEYGHTVGHAVELAMAGAVPHGIAIGIGMVVAARVASHLNVADVDVGGVIAELLSRLDAPTWIPADIDAGELMARVRRDNKRGYLAPRPGTCDMVLLRDLGAPITTGSRPLTPVPEEIIQRAILECQDSPGTPPSWLPLLARPELTAVGRDG